MAKTDSTLYSRDFASRPLAALGIGLVLGVLLAAAAIAIGLPVLAAIAVLPIAGGVWGFLTATTHLDVRAGRVSRRSRLNQIDYDAATLSVERRGTSDIFVIAPREHSRKVLCTFQDDDVDYVRDVFARAGVAYVESQPAPESPVED
jgi:hypothetical protein